MGTAAEGAAVQLHREPDGHETFSARTYDNEFSGGLSGLGQPSCSGCVLLQQCAAVGGLVLSWSAAVHAAGSRLPALPGSARLLPLSRHHVPPPLLPQSTLTL